MMLFKKPANAGYFRISLHGRLQPKFAPGVRIQCFLFFAAIAAVSADQLHLPPAQ